MYLNCGSFQIFFESSPLLTRDVSDVKETNFKIAIRSVAHDAVGIVRAIHGRYVMASVGRSRAHAWSTFDLSKILPI